MTQALSDNTLAQLSSHIAAHMGLHFPRAKWHTLEQAISSATRDLGFRDPEACAAWFIATPFSREFMESMAGYLTVGETYFLRESRSFEILESEIIPELVRTRRGDDRRLRIWSAGCATGEEPYTIAILLHRMRHLLEGWNISILATDINPLALRRGAEGVYTEWSFRNTPPWFRENYFRRTGNGRWKLVPQIRKMVSFAYLNLVEDFYPSLLNDTNAMDAIFCRNVLMYFTPERARKVVERLHLSLVDRGWLFVSPCETSHLLFSRFKAVNFPEAILYRKESFEEREKRRNGETERNYEFPPLSSSPGYPLQEPSPLPTLPASPVREASPAPRRPGSPLQEASPDPYETALALYERGAYGEAAERLAAILSRQRDDAQALALLCRIRANEGELAEALRLSEQAISADKLNAGLHYLRAVILQEQGTDEEAVASLRRALYLDQELVFAHLALGNIALRQGKGKESRKHFDNVLALLDRYRPDEVLPESEGVLAGRLTEIIRSTAGCR